MSIRVKDTCTFYTLVSSKALLFYSFLFYILLLHEVTSFGFCTYFFLDLQNVSLEASHTRTEKPVISQGVSTYTNHHGLHWTDVFSGGQQSLPDTSQQKTCACPRCVGDPGVSDWFDENYDPDISPVWTRDNVQLPSDVYYWWVVSNNLI